MLRFHVVVGFGILGLALLVGTGTSQEKKEKVKGQLPPGWSKLELSAEQKAKIYTLQKSYRDKVKQLQKEIQQLQAQERKDMLSVLTDDQKDMLRKLTLGDDTPKKKDAKKSPAKDD